MRYVYGVASHWRGQVGGKIRSEAVQADERETAASKGEVNTEGAAPRRQQTAQDQGQRPGP